MIPSKIIFNQLQKILVIISLMLNYSVFASTKDYGQDHGTQNYGTRGPVFEIKEESLLDVIGARLKAAKDSGKLEYLQNKFKERAIRSIKNPKPVSLVMKATANREFLFDPSYQQIEDALDHKGQIVVKAGTRINPLDIIGWGAELLFIDGRDPAQINWAMSKIGKGAEEKRQDKISIKEDKNINQKIILIAGSPLEIEEKYKIPIYFDQAGTLCRKFNIKAVPAIIGQEGKYLKIQEIKL